jgi:hypothetical protein
MRIISGGSGYKQERTERYFSEYTIGRLGKQKYYYCHTEKMAGV